MRYMDMKTGNYGGGDVVAYADGLIQRAESYASEIKDWRMTHIEHALRELHTIVHGLQDELAQERRISNAINKRMMELDPPQAMRMTSVFIEKMSNGEYGRLD